MAYMSNEEWMRKLQNKEGKESWFITGRNPTIKLDPNGYPLLKPLGVFGLTPREHGITTRCCCGAIIDLDTKHCTICKWKLHLADRAAKTLSEYAAYQRAAPKGTA